MPVGSSSEWFRNVNDDPGACTVRMAAQRQQRKGGNNFAARHGSTEQAGSRSAASHVVGCKCAPLDACGGAGPVRIFLRRPKFFSARSARRFSKKYRPEHFRLQTPPLPNTDFLNTFFLCTSSYQKRSFKKKGFQKRNYCGEKHPPQSSYEIWYEICHLLRGSFPI